MVIFQKHMKNPNKLITYLPFYSQEVLKILIDLNKNKYNKNKNKLNKLRFIIYIKNYIQL